MGDWVWTMALQLVNSTLLAQPARHALRGAVLAVGATALLALWARATDPAMHLPAVGAWGPTGILIGLSQCTFTPKARHVPELANI